MKELLLQDPLTLQEISATDLGPLVVLAFPDRTVGIRKEDFDRLSGNVFQEKFAEFTAASPCAYARYRRHGQYDPRTRDLKKTYLNEKRHLIVHDRFAKDGFFYDLNLRPIPRPFPFRFPSQFWNTAAVKAALNKKLGISQLSGGGRGDLHGVYTAVATEFTYVWRHLRENPISGIEGYVSDLFKIGGHRHGNGDR